MLLYHGTTRRSAEQIAVEGFAPRKPSRRVWFAHSKGYALRRAKVKARRRHDRPVVLQCELDLATLRRKLGSKRVVYRAGIVSISGSLPVTVLRHAPGVWDPPSSEPELAAWLNDLLGLKAHRAVSRNDPGLIRLARWIRNRRTSQPYSRLRDSEIVERAASWLPQWFRGVSVATRGYGRPRWPDWRAWEEPKPLTGVHGDCAIPTTRCALRLRACWSTTTCAAIAGCSSWRSTTRSRRLRNWRASSRPIAATTCCGSTGAEAPASRQPGPGAGATSRSAPGLVRCVAAGAAGKPPSFASCG